MQHTKNELTFERIAKNIFEFLIENRIYNKKLQTRYYSGIVKLQKGKKEKISKKAFYLTTNHKIRIFVINSFNF